MSGRQLHRLSALRIAKEVAPGHYADGGGLYMQIASCLRPLTMVSAPAVAIPVAIAMPIPPVDALTMAVLPDRSMITGLLLVETSCAYVREADSSVAAGGAVRAL
ncbi:hypothetical protein OKW30_005077 [Paraburkholderia sp. Clong3]